MDIYICYRSINKTNMNIIAFIIRNVRVPLTNMAVLFLVTNTWTIYLYESIIQSYERVGNNEMNTEPVIKMSKIVR